MKLRARAIRGQRVMLTAFLLEYSQYNVCHSECSSDDIIEIPITLPANFSTHLQNEKC